MAYTDKQGTTIAAADKVAYAYRDGANRATLIIGVISGPAYVRGRTVWVMTKLTDARYAGDVAHVPINMTGTGTGTSPNVVKAGFV